MLRKSANCVSVINPGVCECVCGGGEAGNNPPCVSSQALSASSHRYTAAAAAAADASGRKKPWSASPTDRERQRGRQRERETCTTAGSGVCQRPVEPGTAGGDRSESGGSRQTRL